MTSHVVPLVVFVLCYCLFVVYPRRRSVIAIAGALAIVVAGSLSWHQAVTECVQWNVVGLFFGTLLLAELFMQSRMPAVIAEKLVDSTRTMRGAMLAICALASVLSMFVENVAVVLVVAPVALSLAERLKTSPVRLLILIALCSNLQGTATLVGDPPSMILAGHLKMTFNDFFVYRGRLGIFFVVQAGAVGAFLVAASFCRAHRQRITLVPVDKLRSFVPGILILALIGGLSVSAMFDREFRWFAGTFAMAMGGIGLMWYRVRARWGSTRKLVGTLDWDTTLFLVGVFVLVGAISKSGWLDSLAQELTAIVGSNTVRAYILIVGLAVVVSAFVDNVPFLLAMIPVTQTVARNLGTEVPLLMFGLLVGSCLDGNITPIGASANIVAVGMLNKRGHAVSFREFMAVGCPFTLAAVIAASALLWLIWN